MTEAWTHPHLSGAGTSPENCFVEKKKRLGFFCHWFSPCEAELCHVFLIVMFDWPAHAAWKQMRQLCESQGWPSGEMTVTLCEPAEVDIMLLPSEDNHDNRVIELQNLIIIVSNQHLLCVPVGPHSNTMTPVLSLISQQSALVPPENVAFGLAFRCQLIQDFSFMSLIIHH